MKPPSLTRRALWLVLPTLATLVYVSTLVEYPLDFWHHATIGRLIAQTGSIPNRDVFTCTIGGDTIIDQGWLADLATYWLFSWGGFELVQFAAAVCYGLAVAITTATAWRRSQSAGASTILALGTVGLLLANLGIRPQAVSFLLFALELHILFCSPGHWWGVAAVAVIQVVWTNIHGAFPLGTALPGIFLLAALGTSLRQSGLRGAMRCRMVWYFAACTTVAVLAAFCNPCPSRTLDYVWGVASKCPQRGIQEWLPTWSGSFTGNAFFLSLAFIVAIVFTARRQMQLVEWLVVIVFGLLASRYQRMVAWWAMAMAPAMAPHLARLVKTLISKEAAEDETPSAAWATLVLILVWLGMTTPWTRLYNPLLPRAKRQTPVAVEPRELVQFLVRDGFHGHVFAPVEWGAFLTWHLPPEARIFIDGRIDLFPDSVWRDYERIANAQEDWATRLDHYGVQLVVWNRKLSDRLPRALKLSRHWEKIYEDAIGTVYRKTIPSISRE